MINGPILRIVSVLFLFTFALALSPTAHASGCAAQGGASSNFLSVGVKCYSGGSVFADAVDTQTPGTSASSVTKSPYTDYEWTIACFGSSPTAPVNDECSAAQACVDPLAREFRLWGREGGAWTSLGTQCFGGTPATPGEYVPPEVTPDDVLSALERTGLPYLTVQTQPSGETLVNFDTIFYVDPQQVSVDLTILGQAVDVEATPAGYEWRFGDGSGLSTRSPGAPYPSKEITHRYADAHVTMEPSVTVSYTARFRVGGGAWQEIDGTVSSAGPGTPLLVREATPLLTAGEG